MKNKLTKKYKNVQVIKSTQGMAPLSLAVIEAEKRHQNSSTPRARALSFFGAFFKWSNNKDVYSHASSVPRARILSLLGYKLIYGVLAVAILIAPISALTFASRAEAATSNQLNFQGRLLSSAGGLIPDGNYHVELKLYNALSSAGSSQGSCAGDANCLWTETRSTGDLVTIQNGYYSVYLGDVTALPTIDWSQDLFLGMNIGGTGVVSWDGEMTPRFKLTAVPYAFSSSNVASSETNTASTDSDAVSITTGNALGVTSNSGNLTLDVGTATGTSGTINLGSANASALNIGNSGAAFTLQGSETSTFIADNGTFATTLSFTDPTANNAIVLPDESGTICTTGSVCAGYASSLQTAYAGGNSILTSTGGGNLSVTLADATNFNVDITGTGSFIVQDGGASIFTVADGGVSTFDGDLAVNSSSLTTDEATFNLINTTATTVNFAGGATTLEIGAATGTTSINNNLTVDGTAYIESDSTAAFQIDKDGSTPILVVDTNTNTAGGTLAVGGGITNLTGSNEVLIVQGNINPAVTHFSSSDTAAYGALYRAVRSRGTNASPTAVTDNDQILNLQGVGYVTGGSNFSTGAEIQFSVDGTPTATQLPAEILLRTRPAGGGLTDRLAVRSSGEVEIYTLGTADTDTILCRNSSNAIATCSSGAATSLQSAYNGGNTILTSTGVGDLSVTLADATDFVVDITGTGNFVVQDSGTSILTVADGGISTFTNNVRLDNDADSNLSLSLDSGATGTQDTHIDFSDQGSLQWRVTKNSANDYIVNDVASSSFRQQFVQGGHSYFQTGSDSSGIYFRNQSGDDLVVILANGNLVFEGNTADGFETVLSVADPTADNVIILPDESGTICTTGSICSGYASSLQSAYNGGNTILTSTGVGDLSVTLADATNFNVDIDGTGSFIIQDGGVSPPVLEVSDNGYFDLQNTADSVSAYEFKSSGGTTILNIDTVNGRIGTKSATGATNSQPFRFRTGDVTGGAGDSGDINLQVGSVDTGLRGSIQIGTDGSASVTVGSASAPTYLAGSSLNFNAATWSRSAAGTTTISLSNGADTTLFVDNTGAGDANLTVSGLITANSGLTVQNTETFTFAAEAFVDFVGGGLVNSSGVLSIDATSANGFFQQGGNNFGATAVLGTGDSNNLQFIVGGIDALTVYDEGAVIFQNEVDTTAGFQVLDENGGNPIFNVDTVNERIGIGTNAPTANLSFSESSDQAVNVITRTSNNDGRSLTVTAGAGGAGASNEGGVLVLQGGAAGSGGNANGGNVVLTGGVGIGTGQQGLVVVENLTFASSSLQTCTGGGTCTITQANVDATGAIIVTADTVGTEVILPDPSITTAGRLIYVTSANGSQDFTLTLNDAEGTEVNISLRGNETATIIWNEDSDWTAAGASSSNTLQSAYNNTLTSAGGAEILLNAPGGDADGFTIRNNDATPINGGILEVQSAIGTNLFSVNNIATEYAANGGAEDSANFTTDWTIVGTSVLSEENVTVATGLGAVQIDNDAVNEGVRNNLATALSTSTQYMISFTAQATVTLTNANLDVYYSRNGGGDVESCTNTSTDDITTTGWTKFTCTITTDGTSAGDADLIIRQLDGTTRTIYIDNLSITENSSSSAPDNVQIGGGIYGGPVTLFTLDRASAPPVANDNETYLGSMYYDTTSGRIQCYEADGWGACGSAPNNYVNLNPEYPGSVLNGTGVGTMTADFCANQGGVLQVNYTAGLPCDTAGENYNYYNWTSPQATEQEYSIYITYQLPAEFGGFDNNNTVTLTARTDSTALASVTYEMFRNEEDVITACGSETSVTTNADEWQTVPIDGDEADGCGFTTASADNFVIFKINMKARGNANAYVSTLSFTTNGR